MNLAPYIKCPNCSSLLQLSEEEQLQRTFICPICTEKTVISNSDANLRNIGSYLNESDYFITKYQDNEIRVVFDARKEIIVLYNDEIVAEKSITTSILGDWYEVDFSIKEHGRIVPYSVRIDIIRGRAYSMHCSIYRKKKRIYLSESKSSKMNGYIIGGLCLFILIVYLLTR
ncbi:MAG: hypothetical protein JST20_00585 [Bacteroidetes bacterium]|nr:hypothetical protein [Bacteroidota bacterium]